MQFFELLQFFNNFRLVLSTLTVSLGCKKTIPLRNLFCWNTTSCDLHIEGMPKCAVGQKFSDVDTHFRQKSQSSVLSSRSQLNFSNLLGIIDLKSIFFVHQNPEIREKRRNAFRSEKSLFSNFLSLS